MDTCAAIWLSAGAKMTQEALSAIDTAAAERRLWLSPISGWEVAAKISAGKLGAPPLHQPPGDWYAGILALSDMREAVLTGAIALRSALLPWLHRDPADRFLIATAIELEAVLVTRDRLIFSYADAGLVEVLNC